MNYKKTLLKQPGQGKLEAVILLFGLLIIVAFFFPSIYQGMKLVRSPQAKNTAGSSPSTNQDSPACGEVLGIPGLSGRAPFRVTLVGTGRQTNYPLIGFQWDFDNDGVWDTDVVKTPQTHTFLAPGKYPIKLLVLDEKKNSAVCSAVVEVSP